MESRAPGHHNQSNRHLHCQITCRFRISRSGQPTGRLRRKRFPLPDRRRTNKFTAIACRVARNSAKHPSNNTPSELCLKSLHWIASFKVTSCACAIPGTVTQARISRAGETPRIIALSPARMDTAPNRRVLAAVIICDGARPRFPKIIPDVDAGFCEFHYWNNERCRCELQFDDPARIDARRAGSA